MYVKEIVEVSLFHTTYISFFVSVFSEDNNCIWLFGAISILLESSISFKLVDWLSELSFWLSSSSFLVSSLMLVFFSLSYLVTLVVELVPWTVEYLSEFKSSTAYVKVVKNDKLNIITSNNILISLF